VHGGLPLEVAYYLLNRKKRELTQIENDYEIEVTVKGKTSYLLNQLELETVKREKPRAEDVAKSDAESDEAPAPVPRFESVAVEFAGSGPAVEGGSPVEGGKKRKRRRKKKKGGTDTESTSLSNETSAPAEEQPAERGHEQEPVDSEEPGTPAVEIAGKPKKRRRRRGRKGAKGMDETVIDETATSTAPAGEPAPAVPATIAELPQKVAETAAVQEKPKRTRSPRAKKTVDATPDVTEAAAPEPVAAAVAVPKKPRRAAAKKVVKPVPVEVETPAEPQTAPPKRAPRPRRPKKTEEIQ
jgi:ribonuclease E